MRGLTQRQREILQYICSFIEDKGYPPTLREVGCRFGISSTNGVSDHIKALERKGFLCRERKMSRSLVPSSSCIEMMCPGRGHPRTVQSSPPRDDEGSGDGTVSVPVLGKVAAGQPLLALEEADSVVRVDPSLTGGGKAPDFALTIKGDSMIGDGILPGDLVFVRRSPVADPGDIVVALLGEEATVKRYYRQDDSVRLQPSNPTLKPIFVGPDRASEFRILGRVIGLCRQI